MTEENKMSLQLKPGKTIKQQSADLFADGLLQNAAIIDCFSSTIQFSPEERPGGIEHYHALKESASQTGAGDLGNMEAMLTAQATTLNTLFSWLLERARLNANDYPQATEKFFKLAFKAQSQTRATIETLAFMKNPQPYVRQLNQAVNQQINNGTPAPSPARENQKSTNELLEDRTNEQWMDTGAQGAASNANKELETVETLDGA